MVLQKTLYLTEYHLFFSQLHVILFFFWGRKNFKNVYSSSCNCSKDTWQRNCLFLSSCQFDGLQIPKANHSTVLYCFLYLRMPSDVGAICKAEIEQPTTKHL